MSKATNSSYNVLMQVQSQNEAERLITLFRSGGMAVRVHRVTSEQDFNESIKDHVWDLLIVDNRHPEVTLQFSLDSLKKHKADIPVLLLTDESTSEIRDQAFKFGIQDVINKNDTIHFVHASLREMRNVRNRIANKQLAHDFQELKQRADALLDESDDAIAYVSDGILIKVNDKFASEFGYSAEELDCASLIDLVSAADQEKFKNFFRLFTKGSIEQRELSFNALTKNKEEHAVFMSLSTSTIDGEPCTQLNIRNANEAASAASSGIIDTATELYNRYHLSEKITSTALQIGKAMPSASLLLFRFDGADRLLDDVGFSGLDIMMKDLAGHVQHNFAAGETIARVGDDTLAVISPTSPEKSLDIAKKILSTVENHICELSDRTTQYSCTCAVLQLNNKDARVMLDHAFSGISFVRSHVEKGHAEIYTPEVKEVRLSADEVANIDEAMEMGCFKLLYQPIMSLQGDDKENYEVTLWFSDDNGESYPEALIRNAGSSKLDRWIILESTKALALHRAKGHNTCLMINLTQNALLDESLAPWLGVALKAANLKTDSLVFQFREDDVKNNLKAASKAIAALRAAKIRVSIGFFGKDEDPFKLLKHVSLDLIKVDSSLSTDSKALKPLIDEAKANDLHTIVPDVDNASMLASMWQMGTHYIQGSYLQLPSPVMNFEFADIA